MHGGISFQAPVGLAFFAPLEVSFALATFPGRQRRETRNRAERSAFPIVPTSTDKALSLETLGRPSGPITASPKSYERSS